MSEILEHKSKVVDDSLVVKIHNGGGYRCLYRGDMAVADESPDQWAKAAKYAVQVVGNPLVSSVALIGGGFCITAKVLGEHYFTTIFEIEPTLKQFAPPYTEFVPGDWKVTFPARAKEFDCVILDTGEGLEASGLRGMVNPSCLLMSYETV